MKRNTFTQEVKEEICNNDFTNLQFLSVLSSFILINANFVEEDDERKIVLATENAKIAKLIFQALNQTFGISPSFTYIKKMKLDKAVVYRVIIKDKIDEILSYLELCDEEGYQIFPHNLISEKEELRAFIAGAFLASGSVNSPSSDNYHLQFVVNDEECAKYFIHLLNKFKNDKSMDFKYIKRKSKYVVYLKKADQIANFLAVSYANVAMMDFENVRIQKDFINSDNRYQICFNANYQKTIEKANEQIEDIKYIEEKYGLIHLTDKEQLVAKIRLENQDVPLSEIVRIIKDTSEISVSKSGVSRIFSSFHDLAKKLRRESK